VGTIGPRAKADARRVRSWEQGASGERIVGARLDRIDGIEVLHDRRVPRTRATIDHIAIGPRGVYVIQAKLARPNGEHELRRRTVRRERSVWISGHDETMLVTKMSVRVNAITRAMSATPITVTAALCFVDAPWPSLREPFTMDGVWVGWPDALPDLVGRPGLLTGEAMKEAARVLETRLPPA
jgi:hypothetical protein